MATTKKSKESHKSFKKIVAGRNRFLASPVNQRLPLKDWLNSYEKIIKSLKEESHFQRVGSAVYLKISDNSELHSEAFCEAVMIEVTGIPSSGQNYLDFEPREVLVYQFEKSSFLVSVEEIQDKITELGEDSGYIVIDGPKIALHFFR